ncbi:hypothetical protein CYMTET_17665, partial [Cymbomonas tetramitiformis]
EQLTWGRFRAVLSAKVEGTVHLHREAAALQLPLEHFVLFSSVYGLLGYRELTHYAAANAFQDGVAAARSAAGLPGAAVSWGVWAGAGMAQGFGTGFEAFWRGEGMRFVELPGGMATLRVLMHLGAPHCAVLPAKWLQYARRHGRRVHPLLQRLVGDAAPPAPTSGSPPPSITLTAAPASANDTPPSAAQHVLQYMTPEGRQRAAQAHVTAEVRELLVGLLEGRDEAELEAPPEAPLMELGLTSMLAVDLMTRLGEMYGLELSPAAVYEHVHIAGVARHIVAHLPPPNTTTPPTPNRSASVADTAMEVVDDGTYTGRLRSTSPAARWGVVREQVTAVLAEVLGGADARALRVEQGGAPLKELGLSTIGAVDLDSRLRDAYGLPELSPAPIYEEISVDGLCHRSLSEIQMATGAPPPNNWERPMPEDVRGGIIAPAVTGLSCRLPGATDTLQELWDGVLLKERDCVVSPPPGRPTNGTARSGFLTWQQVARFDREVFGLSGAEAAAMDPQQRLLLEGAQEALEDAGQGSVEGRSSRHVGVYVALETMDYAVLHQGSAVPPTPYCGTGWHMAIAANRISYLFDFTGPSVVLNTACSSSLVCIDSAVITMRHRRLAQALVGGANIQLCTAWSEAFACAGMLSPSFKCKFGDDSADGCVRHGRRTRSGPGSALRAPAPLSAARSGYWNQQVPADQFGVKHDYLDLLQ